MWVEGSNINSGVIFLLLVISSICRTSGNPDTLRPTVCFTLTSADVIQSDPIGQKCWDWRNFLDQLIIKLATCTDFIQPHPIPFFQFDQIVIVYTPDFFNATLKLGAGALMCRAPAYSHALMCKAPAYSHALITDFLSLSMMGQCMVALMSEVWNEIVV